MNDLYGEINEGIGTGILVTTFIFALATKLLGRKPENDKEAEEAVNQLSDEEKREFAKQLVADIELKMARDDRDEFVKAGLPKSKPPPDTTASMDDLRKMRNRNLEEIVKEELEAALDEKRKKKKKKKKKKKAKRDACYHKVKSRYKVWPSAYASGALVKCRKVGAKNWGNSKKESVQIMIEDEISQVLHEKKNKFSKHDMYDPKTGEKSVASVKKDHDKMAKKGFVHVDPKKIEKILRDEGGAAGMDPFLKEFGEDMKDEIVKALDNMPNVGQHEDGDYILDDDKEVNISEGMNCGCGQDPCKTYGKNNAKIKVSIAEEIEKVLEEALYYGLIEENIEEKKKKRKKKACKPSKGKKFARRVKGKCVSYGQSGKAKGGGPRIKPGTGKGNAYCARSYGDMKSHGKDCSGKDRGTPLCLSRQKWKCSGKYSRKGK